MKLLEKSEILTLVNEVIEEKIENINYDDNLIILGMHSLKMVQLATTLQQKGIEVNFAELASEPTINAWHKIITRKINNQIKNSSSVISEIKTFSDKDSPFSLATMQHAYWIGRNQEQKLGGVAAHGYSEFAGKNIDPTRLETALHKVIQRHPMLRTKFNSDGTQNLITNFEFPKIKINDFRKLNDANISKKLKHLRELKTNQKLPIEIGKVLEIELSLLPSDNTILHIDIDIIVADAVSYRILMRELADFYTNPEISLPDISFSYQKYLAKKNSYNKASIKSHQKWWSNVIPEFPTNSSLPLKSLAEQKNPTKTIRYEKWFNNKQKQILISKSHENGFTPVAFLITLFALTIDKWSSTTDFILNIPLFNRIPLHPEVNKIIGDFSSSFLLPINSLDIKGNNIIDITQKIQTKLHNYAQHATYEGLDVLRDLGRYHKQQIIAPIVFTSGLNLGEIYSPKVINTFGTPIWSITQGPQVFLDAQITEFNQGILVNWDVRPEAFHPQVAKDMFQNYKKTLETFIKTQSDWANIKLSAINTLPQKQLDIRNQINNNFTSTTKKKLHDTFFEIASKNPNLIAITDSNGISLTYGELRSKALALAGYLIYNDIKAADTVAIQLPKSIDQIIAVLGILAAGAIYVPIGLQQPNSRRDKILNTSRAKAILVNNIVEKISNDINIIDITSTYTYKNPLKNPVTANADSLAYIIFTSGSTGIPKGVEVEHKSALNTIEQCNKIFELTENDKTLALSSLEFDLSVQDIFAPFNTGGSIFIVDDETRLDGQKIAQIIRENNITQLYCVPSILEMILSGAIPKGLGNNLRTILLGGDWVKVELIKKLRKFLPNCRCAGLGGATETAIHHTIYEIPKIIPRGIKNIPFGKPLPNVQVRIVNSAGADCPNWVAGELWVAGAGLARGYCNDNAKTEISFINYAEDRWYKTGDLARFWPDGTVEFLGRKDNQVKIRGYRIELGEIETALKTIPFIKDAVSGSINTANLESKKLFAAITVNKNQITTDDIKNSLTTILPKYMVPEIIKIFPKIPTTFEGKIDRKKINEIIETEYKSTEEANLIPPQNALETVLANCFQNILGMKNISVIADFFELGGDSVLGTKLITLIREELETDEVQVSYLFTSPTVKGLAKQITENQTVPGRLEQVAEVYLEVFNLS